ncbi:hypothetical protein CH272_16965 [Rhodococcus sp. 05-340-1]|uniref:PPE domain-containing protein n=1 Tax=unclassified Rhodococcus (in: high G+C Gram-positive bacteria) TaxID=192944 RepID=UPI000B9A3A9C|nr:MULTISPECIES: PPE domain-containing protein [unclassified Rhodococcus (in: high G+C Gram-positive bacteria)]OZD63426.1 hypothetical protein CH271_22575 [Rhodococcus sp. 05-340-2]OZD75466.1 hypothetical protein CH272_16965 [Rhodococcus sp. 05-340-1]
MTDPYEELAATIDKIVTSTFVTPVGPEFLDSVLDAAFEKANVALDYRGEFEPTEVVITEAFEVMPHEQIVTMVESLGTATIVNSSKNWNDLSAAATTGSDGFRSGIEAAMTSGWSGPTADAVRGGVGNYVSSATALSTSMSLISNKLLEAHSGFTQTQSRMPPVVAPGSSMIDALLPIPFAAKDAVSAREEQQEEARRIMRSVYVPGVLQSDSQVPVLPAAHNPVADGGGSSGGWGLGTSAGGGGGGVGSTSGTTGADGGDSAARTAATQAQAGSAEATEAGRSGTAASEQPGSSGSGSLPPADNSGETRAAAATGPGASGGGTGSGVGAGPGGGYGGTGPGGSGFAGSNGSGYGGGAGYGVGSGGSSGAGSGYGGSVLGPPIGGGAGGGAGGTGGPGSAAAAAGRAGAHGMPGMGAMGGARGAGDNDGEHATPGYLVDVSNGSELIGDLPLVAPPVLGG